MIVFRYVARAYLVALGGALGGMTAIYLIIDFADHAKQYKGPGWIKAVCLLYLCKLALVTYQLAPAALGLAGAVSISALRRTSEITALRALGRSTAAFFIPIAVCAAVVAAAMTIAEDQVVSRANEKAEEIALNVFHSWGDWTRYHVEKRWYRGANDRVYYLGHFEGAGFRDVTIYDLTPDFRVSRRVDAQRIEPMPDGRWRFVNAVTRSFPQHGDDPMEEITHAEQFEQLPDDVELFRVKTGRPAQQRRWELPAQIQVRKKLGLPFREWEVSYWERLAYQLAGIPAALVGAALALRPRRKGHLTQAIGEGFGITLSLWMIEIVCRTQALAGHVAPVVAGFAPTVVVALAAIAWVRWARAV